MASPLVLGPMLRYVDERTASIWVETRDSGLVIVRGGDRAWSARTFRVHGHHYALVEVDGLEPGSRTPYTVEVDGHPAWPEPDSPFPPSTIATRQPGRGLRMAYGSCRTSVSHDRKGNRTHGIDALRAFALAVARGEASAPDLLLFLGDQVYADSTTEAMQQFIRARRDIHEPPGKELKDFEEYAHLYALAFSDAANRWLLSTLPSAMIFDDHDIRDDWNASLSWKKKMEAKPWWHDRIVAGLASYWVYQHLGNLSPEERANDELWQLATAESEHGDEADLGSAIDTFADRCDREPAHYRWSYCRDFDDVRLIVVDSRMSRDLTPSSRGLLGREELEWFDAQLQGGFRHVLIGTSLPFLLPPGLHHLEAWDEALAQGAWGRPAGWVGEQLRQLVDLEHWAAFQNSFQAVARMATELADGGRGPAPETVTFLSGDVHYSFVSEVNRSSGSRIIQSVCSPVRNPLPRWLRWFAVASSFGPAEPLGALAARSAKVPDPPFRWTNKKGPWFDNNLAFLEDRDDGLALTWRSGVVRNGDEDTPRLKQVAGVLVRPRG
jgi:phosphodiesterase/alkaline phosphatase D-like protein